MGIRFDGDCAGGRIGLVAAQPVDLASELIGLATVHTPRLAPPFGLDLAQALKEQHTAWILGAHLGNAARHLVGGVFIHAPDMCPELLITVLSLDGLACLPLFLGNTFEVPIAVLIEAVISHKDRFDNAIILAHADHSEILHVEVHRHGDEVCIFSAFLDLFRFDVFHLGEVQGRGLFAQDQLRTLRFPGGISPARFKVATQFDGIVVPFPGGSRVDLEPGEAGARSGTQINGIQVQREGLIIEGRMITGSWAARLPL